MGQARGSRSSARPRRMWCRRPRSRRP